MLATKFFMAFAVPAALFGLVACSSSGRQPPANGTAAQAAKALFAPAVRVDGKMVDTTGEQANGCVLEIHNISTGKRVKESSVSGRFSILFQDAANMDGLRFRGLCDGIEVYRSADYSAGRLSDMDWKVSLGEITVARGLVAVSGRVVDESGKTPEDCAVGVYPAGKEEPIASWRASGEYSGEFDIAQAGDFFTIEAQCAGYARRGTSGVYGPQMVDADTNSIRTRDLVVGN